VFVVAKSTNGSGIAFHRGNDLFVLTNWHVVKPCATFREGKPFFQDVKIIQHFVKNGIQVSGHECNAEIVTYTDEQQGRDLALLRLRDNQFIKVDSKFYPLDAEIPWVGMPLYHIGCFNGIEAPGSLTTGIISAHGRHINGRIFDQVSVTCFPGSSGGGVFDSEGRCIGLLTRRSGETLGYINPIREIANWAKSINAMWILDQSPPTNIDELMKARDSQLGAQMPEWPFIFEVSKPGNQPIELLIKSIFKQP
jgi:S1-C subfamily serine protease